MDVLVRQTKKDVAKCVIPHNKYLFEWWISERKISILYRTTLNNDLLLNKQITFTL